LWARLQTLGIEGILLMDEYAEIAAKARFWLDNGGREQLEAAFDRVQEENRRWAEATRVRWQDMMEPCTI